MVPEIPYPNLPDIALVTWFNGILPINGQFYNGLVIYYNPLTCQHVGPNLSAFFRAHEYGHIELHHLQKKTFQKNPFTRHWMTRRYELEADSFATKLLLSHGNIQGVKAAINWFYGRGPIQYVPTHPPGTARANNIISTARSLGYT